MLSSLFVSAITCDDNPHEVENTLVNINGIALGSTAVYTCKPGYRRTGEIHTSLCTEYGWETPDIVCLQPGNV